MESRKDIAAEKKASGKYNCTQAVLTTYADLTGLDEETAMAMTDGFAAGMTNMEGTCGAIVGAGLVLGLANRKSSDNQQTHLNQDEVKNARRKTRKGMKAVMTKFQERNHATQCRLLKGIDTHIVLRECPLCVSDACEFLEEQLNGTQE